MFGSCTIFAVLYLSYLTYLSVQVFNDSPSIETSYEYLDKLSIPNVEICGDWSDVQVSRCVFTMNDGVTVYDGCREFLSRESVHGNTYCYLYATNDTYFYGNEETIHDQSLVRNLDFYFKINDVAAVTSHFLSVGTVTVQLTDPAYSVADLRIKQELQLKNGFAGIQNTSSVVTFKKTTLRTISPHDIFATLGFNPTYHNTPYLSTVSKNFPMNPDAGSMDTGHFSIAPGSFINKVKSEKRSHTMFSALESATFALVMIAGVRMFLGRGHCSRYAKLNNEDLTSVSTPDEKSFTEQRMKQLENRILELESILGNQGKR